MSIPDLAPYRPDEDVLEAVGGGGAAVVRVVRQRDAAVVVGRGGKPEVEVDLAAARGLDVPVLRRRGGGCAVLLDPGNLVVSLTAPVPGIGGITSSFRSISAWLCDCLADCGIPDVRQRGVSDLAVGDRKIGGSCIYRTRGLLHYGSTLLVEADLDLMERTLRHPPREPDYRRGRRHRDFVASLRDLGLAEDPASLLRRLDREVQRRLPRLIRDLIGAAGIDTTH